jgi:glycerophosphoryl diester phosphodiesterase
MRPLPLDLFASLISGELQVEARGSNDLLRLDWSGHSTAPRPETILAPCFEEVLERARSQECGIELHLEQLESSNGSITEAVINFIHAARQQGTRVAISFDAGQEWQSSCFEALRYLEKPDGLVKIRALQ